MNHELLAFVVAFVVALACSASADSARTVNALVDASRGRVGRWSSASCRLTRMKLNASSAKPVERSERSAVRGASRDRGRSFCRPLARFLDGQASQPRRMRRDFVLRAVSHYTTRRA